MTLADSEVLRNARAPENACCLSPSIELRPDQAEYIGVKPEGPFKADHYRY